MPWIDVSVVVMVAIVSGVAFWAMHRALVDDAYITLVYARNLAEHGHWGLLLDRTSNTATSPLNVVVLAAFAAFTGDAVRGLGVVYVLNGAALAVGLLLMGRSTGLGRRLALIAGPLLALNPLLVSTAGLETMLAVTALVFLLWASAGERAWLVGALTGVTVLLRLDLVVVAVVVLLLRRHLWRRLHWVVLVAAAVALPWFAFSWFALGSAVPDTLLIKTLGTWGNYPTGLVTKYFRPYPLGVIGTLAPAVLGVVAVLTWTLWRRYLPGPDRAVVPIAGATALAYYLTFVFLGVYPFFWYYGVPIAGLALAASAGLATLTLQRDKRLRFVAAGLALAAAFVPTAVAWTSALDRHVPLQIALVKGNWAETWQYTKIGRELPQVVGHRTPVQSPGEIGTILYFCRCELIDRFSDRGQLAEAIDGVRGSSILGRLNYLWLDTTQLQPTPVRYVLQWRPGPDLSGRGWNVYSLTGHRRHQGHIALLRPNGETVPFHGPLTP